MIRSQARKTVTATVTATSWEEAHYDDGGPPLAEARSTQTYSGDLAAESSTRMLLVYVGGDPAEPRTLVGDYVAYERVTGTLDGRAGSFVVEQRGRHEDGVARTTGRIVPGSGTGELTGIRGEVEASAADMTYQVTLSYAIEDPAVHH